VLLRKYKLCGSKAEADSGTPAGVSVERGDIACNVIATAVSTSLTEGDWDSPLLMGAAQAATVSATHKIDVKRRRYLFISISYESRRSCCCPLVIETKTALAVILFRR
jgi:hypothetical protein